jgi:hypothetical protein
MFFVNSSGMLAVSLDEGAHVILPAGRHIERASVWEESEDEWSLEDLTLEQCEKVEGVWKRQQEARARGPHIPHPEERSPAWQRDMLDPEPAPVKSLLDLDDLF